MPLGATWLIAPGVAGARDAQCALLHGFGDQLAGIDIRLRQVQSYPFSNLPKLPKTQPLKQCAQPPV